MFSNLYDTFFYSLTLDFIQNTMRINIVLHTQNHYEKIMNRFINLIILYYIQRKYISDYLISEIHSGNLSILLKFSLVS